MSQSLVTPSPPLHVPFSFTLSSTCHYMISSTVFTTSPSHNLSLHITIYLHTLFLFCLFHSSLAPHHLFTFNLYFYFSSLYYYFILHYSTPFYITLTLFLFYLSPSYYVTTPVRLYTIHRASFFLSQFYCEKRAMPYDSHIHQFR